MPDLAQAVADFNAYAAQLTPVDRMLLADDLELDLTGGCSACGWEPDWMCADCGRCGCHDHDTCTRPTA
jgi:hypothetical protein